jgi:hypothetical protein
MSMRRPDQIPFSPRNPHPKPSPFEGVIGCGMLILVACAIVVGCISFAVSWWRGSQPTGSSAPAQRAPLPPRSIPAFVRPPLGPDGRPWPTIPSYIVGIPRLRTGGYSTVKVDNSRCSTDVLAKIFALDSGTPAAVRVFFIPAGSSFTADSLEPGVYDVRYQDLSDGELARSERFDLEERRTLEGFEYSTIELTLYKVVGGNTRTYPLSASEF